MILFVRIKDEELVDQRVREISLIFPINLNVNRNNCFTYLDKDTNYTVIGSKSCTLKVSEDIKKENNNYFRFNN